MPINPDAVGSTSEPHERSWTSKDALLYAVGVGAGFPEPLEELPFTTENSKDVKQQVLPTFAVIIGAGGGAMRNVGSFNPVMLVHGEQGIKLPKPIPLQGKNKATGKTTGIFHKGSEAVIASQGES